MIEDNRLLDLIIQESEKTKSKEKKEKSKPKEDKKKDGKDSGALAFLKRVQGSSLEDLNYLRHMCTQQGKCEAHKIVLGEMIKKLQNEMEELKKYE